MERKYYIIKVPNENILHSLNVCIGVNSTQRYSLDKSMLFVKTNADLIAKEEGKGVSRNKILPPGLTTEYSYEDVLKELRGVEWQNQEI
jgi:hypothetical protein